MSISLTPAQRENIVRTIDAYCARTGTARHDIKPDQSQSIADEMRISQYANVVEAIETVLTQG